MFHVEHSFLPVWKEASAALKQRNALLRSGRVDNAASLITLQWLLLYRDTLDREWGAAS